MNHPKSQNSPRRQVLLALAVSFSMAGAACSNSDASNADRAGGTMPNEIRVISTNPLTGPAAYAGIATNKGYELAVEEINASGMLDDSTLVLETKDTGGEPQTAAAQVTQAIADDDVAAIFGDVLSSSAVAQAPVAEKGGLPIIFTQAGTDGVVIGDYTYRYTALMPEYYPIIADFIEEQSWESLAIVYAASNPTLADVATKTLPAIAQELGIEITKSIGTQATTQDFTAPISQLLQDDPDGVAVLQVGAASPTAVTQLRRAGYDAPVLATAGASVGVMEPAGEDGADTIWPIAFHHQMEGQATEDFVEAYRAKYHEDPVHYAAEAYDAAYLLARAIEASGSALREDIRDGLEEVTSEPFTGALGEDLTFEDNSLNKTDGVIVRWTGSTEELIDAAGS